MALIWGTTVLNLLTSWLTWTGYLVLITTVWNFQNPTFRFILAILALKFSHVLISYILDGFYRHTGRKSMLLTQEKYIFTTDKVPGVTHSSITFCFHMWCKADVIHFWNNWRLIYFQFKEMQCRVFILPLIVWCFFAVFRLSKFTLSFGLMMAKCYIPLHTKIEKYDIAL